MENFIEVVQSVILPVVTVALGYFGWRANADKNKLKAELKGLEVANISKEIENQSDWLDLYKKLHNDQAERITQAMDEIELLKKTINKFEHAFKKAHNCIHYDVCPIRNELSKHENRNRKGNGANPAGTGQRKRKSNIRDATDDHADNDGKTEPEP
ncbi:MAG: hypothetical protein ACLVKO_01780 [Dysgonomonas sp.]